MSGDLFLLYSSHSEPNTCRLIVPDNIYILGLSVLWTISSQSEDHYCRLLF